MKSKQEVGKLGEGPRSIRTFETFTKLDRKYFSGEIPVARYLNLKKVEIRRIARELTK